MDGASMQKFCEFSDNPIAHLSDKLMVVVHI